MTINRVLAPIDGSENSLRALKFACSMAAQCDATVVSLYVHTEMSLFSAVRPIIISESK